ELRRTPGSRTGTPTEPLEADLEDPSVGELVEVERSDRSRDAQGGGGVVPGRPAVGARHQAIQVAPQRLVEGGDGGDPSVEVGWSGHAFILKHILLDVTEPADLWSIVVIFRTANPNCQEVRR